MNVILEIEGREAIPVRSIPFITGWESISGISPDVLVDCLCEVSEKRGRSRTGLVAFIFVEGEPVTKMMRKEWNYYAIQLKERSEKLKNMGAGRSKWRDKSIKDLPEGIFIWKSDFEEFYNNYYLKKSISQPQSGSLNFSPNIPSKSKGLLFEGFESCLGLKKSDSPLVPDSFLIDKLENADISIPVCSNAQDDTLQRENLDNPLQETNKRLSDVPSDLPATEAVSLLSERRASWNKEAKLLKKDRPALTTSAIAQLIAKKNKLNPDNRDVETIRKVIGPTLSNWQKN